MAELLEEIPNGFPTFSPRAEWYSERHTIIIDKTPTTSIRYEVVVVDGKNFFRQDKVLRREDYSVIPSHI